LPLWGAAVVSTVDNLLRAYFISQANRAPVLLVFMGVVGGLLAFGLIGAFLGPAILAAALVAWREVSEVSAEEA
jgi:predicted PurR-regulated permease PerM